MKILPPAGGEPGIYPGIAPPSRQASTDGFRNMMSDYPTGVSIVTSRDSDGIPHGMTCSSLTSVSIAPPTLLVCLDTLSRTLRAIHESDEFAVNLLHIDGRSTAELFAARTSDRFSQIPWEPSPYMGMPWLTDHSLAHAECRASGFIQVGDHEIVLGTVTHLSRTDHVPLLYGQRRYSHWQPEIRTGASDE